ACAAAHAVAARLGTGVAALINLLNPQMVIFGGNLAPVVAVGEEDLHAAIHVRALAAPRMQVRLALPALGGDSTLLGAAELAFEPLLRDPFGALAASAV
ncbi:MAG: ROK family protein, partial [Actinomycetota bacterium]|nr:ROK family protein [Actinomycetota bacterium]